MHATCVLPTLTHSIAVGYKLYTVRIRVCLGWSHTLSVPYLVPSCNVLVVVGCQFEATRGKVEVGTPTSIPTRI
jgi:hypothetical protein